MYEDFYQFSGRPFQLTPDPRFYFNSKTHKKAQAYLSYGIEQGAGFIVITGEIGAGKTTLVRYLLEKLDPNTFVSAMIISSQLSGEDLLRSVVAAFGLETEASDKGVLLARLEGFFREQYHKGRRVLLVVDEAQNLPNEALEELRMLSNFQEGSDALLQSFLVGQPEFRARVATAPELEQLRQRVIASHHLSAMDAGELASYIQHRLTCVGWDNDPCFTADAVEAIYYATGGVPRKVNNLCTRLLLLGSLEELHEINGETVKEIVGEMNAELGVSDAKPAQDEVSRAEAAEPTVTLDVDGQNHPSKTEERLEKLETMVADQGTVLQHISKALSKIALINKNE